MSNQNFQTIQKSAANQSRAIPLQPASGYLVPTTAFGSNAASTEIVRTSLRKSA